MVFPRTLQIPKTPKNMFEIETRFVAFVAFVAAVVTVVFFASPIVVHLLSDKTK